jgi:Asp-tRNA(Asn)/Glu-tRNA(Gln) amidotransferase B subunit
MEEVIFMKENKQEKEQKELEKLMDEVIKENQEALEELAKK